MTNTAKKSLAGELLIPVYYEDTDFSGYVFHANFLKYFDRAREELLGRERLRDMFANGRHFVVKEAQIHYHKPLTHGDTMRVHTRIDHDHAVILHCHHSIHRLSDGEKAVTALVQLVMVNARGLPLRVPTDLLA